MERPRKLSLRGRPPDPEILAGKRIERDGSSRSEAPEWLLGLIPQSVQLLDLATLPLRQFDTLRVLAQ